MEKKKIMKKFIKNKQEKKVNYKKYIAVASLAVISFGAIGTIPTLASTNPTLYKLANMMGIETDLDNYTAVINKPITKGDITVQLGEVIYDKHNNKLKVSTFVNHAEKINPDEIVSIFASVHINGEEINVASMWETKVIDENTVGFVTDYLLDSTYEGKMDIRVAINTVEVNGNYERGEWNFDFTADGDQLASDTKVVELKKEFTLDNDEKLTLSKYTNNNLGASIFYTTNNLLFDHLMLVKGTDNLGNEVVFSPYHGQGEKGGEFRLSKEESKLSPEASSMTLNLYTLAVPEQEGPIEGEYEKLGESFTIELK